MKKLFLVIFIIMLICQPVFAQTNEPKVLSQGAVLMELETGRVLWGSNENQPLAMASTTKIMTAILAIESGKLEEIVITSKRAASAPDVQMNLAVGEGHKLKDLLYPLMLESSNDAAIAIAEHIGGSVEEFCAMMTEKAKEIGTFDTIFETPNGLDQGEHHSTAYDMALITRYALKNEKFVEIINTPSITIGTEGNPSKTYSFTNRNRLLREYEGAIGVKTGFTGKAGQCFVGAAERNGITLISVVLASGWGSGGKEQKWKDTKAILNYGFDNYTNNLIVKAGDGIQDITVNHSREETVPLVYKEDIIATLTENEKSIINVKFEIPTEIEAPIEVGQKIGIAKIYIGENELCGTSDIISSSSIARHDFETSLKKIINSWLNIGKECIL